jgi:hypothetical protein
MAALYNTLPRHGTIFGLFPQQQQQQHQQQQQQLEGLSHPQITQGNGSAFVGTNVHGGMDDSFELQEASFDCGASHGLTEDNDLSFASTGSFASPQSPPEFGQMESSPYGMDICSPSPGHPLYGKRFTHAVRGMDSAAKIFGQNSMPVSDFLAPPSIANPPGTLLKRLTAEADEVGFNRMSVGSIRSTSSRGSGTGKVASIKTISSAKERDSLSKARARARGILPHSWTHHARNKFEPQLAHSNSSSALNPARAAIPNQQSPVDASMDDAMDIDSPLHARGPPKAQVKPRPLSLFIPSANNSDFSILAQQGDATASPAPVSAFPGFTRNKDQLAAHFFDTPEPEVKTAAPRLGVFGETPDPFNARNSSPPASPSAQRLERCLSAGLAPSSSSTSLASGLPPSSSGSSAGPLSANPLLSKKSSVSKDASRIPVWNKSLHRPGLAPLIKVEGGGEPKEAHSAGVVPSARMATLNPRRAVSAFIQHDPLQSAPLPNVGAAAKPVGSRPTGGLAKGRVVSMLVTKSNFGEGEEASSDNDCTFDSPSAPRAVGAHRRMKSNGAAGVLRGPKSAFPTGSMRMRSPSQQYPKPSPFQSMHPAPDPSPFKPLLPFGDGEQSGKILPCHSVKHDGLMRITPDTLRSLLSGVYDSQISSYQIIDCRFGFEFEGGHIAGAVNLNKDEDIERFLFEEAIKNGALPPPSQSGTPGVRQPVLIFHCEFSAKRGPTL